MEILFQLFLSFFKIGAFSFGGGYAMLPLLEKEIIVKHNWLSSSEFIDIFAISEMTPGPIAVNSATFLGFKVAGVLGSFIATLAVILPSFIVITLLYLSIEKFKESKYIDWIFQGIRPVVLGLIAAAGVTVGKTGLTDIKGITIAGFLFYLVSFKEINPIWAIIIGGGLGFILY